MALTPGTRLGPYEILTPLGAGGMGEVYRARDTRLHRDVAIKVLPSSFAADPDRLMRFEREARTLATLNHPHIAQIHGLEESSSPDAGTIRALVMELVEGEDLSQRIARGPLPLDEALGIARQIAEALDAAHEQAIIHRDLKPANIKIREDGTVKVLDFGLAKALADSDSVDRSDGAFLNSPTITSPALTMRGVILGTAAYMSPEQAKAKLVDKRADIWAFGCIFHEMLTGMTLFVGETVSETIAEVLKKDVDLRTLPAATPLNVRRVIERCLERDPRRRLRDIGDALFELNAQPTTDQRAPSRGAKLAWAFGLVAATSLALAAFLVFRSGQTATSARARPIHFAVSQPGLTVFGEASISQDGTRIAFRGTDGTTPRLWTRALNALVAVPIPGTEGGRGPFWSPDGSEIGFFNTRGLVAVQVANGLVRTISSNITLPTEMDAITWTSDGTILLGGASPYLIRINATTGAITPISDSREIRYPTLLPNGTHFIYTTRKADAIAEAIAIAPLSDPSHGRVLIDVPSRARYANGYLLYVRDGTLMAHAFDLSRLELSGNPVPLADDVFYFRPTGSASFWAAADTVVYAARAPDVDASVMDRQGAVLSTLNQSDRYSDVAISPDGTQAIFGLTDRRTGTGDLYLYDLTRRNSTRITRDDASEGGVLWSSDGRSIVYGSDRNGGPPDIYMLDLASGGDARRIWAAPGIQYPRAWLPDGRLLIADSEERSGNSVAIRLGDEPTRELLPPRPGASAAQSAAVSTDGRWIAFSASETGPGGRNEIFVQPLGRPGPRVRVSRDGGVGPRWRGSELFFRIIRDAMVTEVGKGDALSFTPPRVLFSLDRPIGFLDVTPDGQRFLVVPGPPVDFAPMRVLVNWRR